ncbi:MAG: PA14 domain-containing protein, partial [bacterium]
GDNATSSDDNATSSPNVDKGQALREYWNDIQGKDISNITLTAAPSGTESISSLEVADQGEDSFGDRLTGLLYPTKTGNYNFYIACKDSCELRLGTGSTAGSKRKIAAITSDQTVGSKEWTKYTGQKSSSINLIAGSKYYFEVVRKAATGTDYLAVAWTTPNSSAPVVISGSLIGSTTPTKLNNSSYRPEGLQAIYSWVNTIKEKLLGQASGGGATGGNFRAVPAQVMPCDLTCPGNADAIIMNAEYGGAPAAGGGGGVTGSSGSAGSTLGIGDILKQAMGSLLGKKLDSSQLGQFLTQGLSSIAGLDSACGQSGQSCSQSQAGVGSVTTSAGNSANRKKLTGAVGALDTGTLKAGVAGVCYNQGCTMMLGVDPSTGAIKLKAVPTGAKFYKNVSL